MKKLLIKAFALIGFMLIGGGNSAWADETELSLFWSENFENADTYKNGWTGNATISQQSRTNASSETSHFLRALRNGTGPRTANYTFPDKVKNINANYCFDMLWANGNTYGDYNPNYLKIYDKDNTPIAFFTVTANNDNNPTYFYKGDETTALGNFKMQGRGVPSTFYHIILEGVVGEGIYLTVTTEDGKTVKIARQLLTDNFAALGRLETSIARSNYDAGQAFDDFTLSIPKKTIITTEKTWNLKSISPSSTIWIALDNSETININGTNMQKSTSAAVDGILFDSNGAVWRVGNFGLRQQSGNGSRNIGIPSLKAGDVVTIVGSWSGVEASIVTGVSSNANIETSNDYKTSTITMNSDGDLSIGLRRTSGSNYYSAESITLEHNEIIYTFMDGDDATIAITNATPETVGNANGWTIETPNGGNRPFGAGQYFEYWMQNPSNGSFDYYQTITGLTNGLYQLSANIYYGDVNNIAGLYAKSGDIEVRGTISTINTMDPVTCPAIVVTDGTLRIGVKNFTTMTTSWFHANDFQLTYIGTSYNVSATVSAAGKATFCSPYNLDFTNTEHIKAYTGEINGNILTMTEVTKVKAGEGVLLVADGEASEVIPVTLEEVAAPQNNALVGTLVDINALATEGEGVNNYILNNGSAGIGFYRANGQKVGAGKAYLQVPASVSPAAIRIQFGGEATAIKTVEATANDAVRYNLAGQRVNANAKGIIVVNGKKTLLR